MNSRLTEGDFSNIKKYFGVELKAITKDNFKEIQKSARKKYHPDNFTKFEDEVVVEMAKDRFQQIEILAAKIQDYLEVKQDFEKEYGAEPDQPISPTQIYASEGMKIDIMTTDKTLKYQLFKRRVIYRGDKFKIPNTEAKIIALEDYSPRLATGFRENIKILLAFGPEDSIREIVHWIFMHISGKTSSFVIEGKIVKIDPYEIVKAIRKEAILELE